MTCAHIGFCELVRAVKIRQCWAFYFKTLIKGKQISRNAYFYLKSLKMSARKKGEGLRSGGWCTVVLVRCAFLVEWRHSSSRLSGQVRHFTSRIWVLLLLPTLQKQNWNAKWYLRSRNLTHLLLGQCILFNVYVSLKFVRFTAMRL